MPIQITEQKQLRKNLPDIRVGDTVRVHQKIKEGSKERIQVFEGVVIKMQGGKGMSGSFTVRRVSLNVGVERSFPWHLPSLVKVERIKSSKVRQARIFYVRGLVGKRARRMKGETSNRGEWEELVIEPEKTDTASEEEVVEEEAKPDTETSNDTKAKEESGAKKDAGESGGESGDAVPAEKETPDSGEKS